MENTIDGHPGGSLFTLPGTNVIFSLQFFSKFERDVVEQRLREVWQQETVIVGKAVELAYVKEQEEEYAEMEEAMRSYGLDGKEGHLYLIVVILPMGRNQGLAFVGKAEEGYRVTDEEERKRIAAFREFRKECVVGMQANVGCCSCCSASQQLCFPCIWVHLDGLTCGTGGKLFGETDVLLMAFTTLYREFIAKTMTVTVMDEKEWRGEEGSG